MNKYVIWYTIPGDNIHPDYKSTVIIEAARALFAAEHLTDGIVCTIDKIEPL